LEQRLLVRVPNWLGDLVMSLGALSGILARWPSTALWCRPSFAGLLRVFFPSAETLAVGVDPVRGFGRLLLMTDSFSSAVAGWRAGIPERTGHTGQFRDLLLTRHLRPLRGRSHHHSLDYDRLASFAGAGPAPVPPPSAMPDGQPHLALFAGASYGEAKIWPGFAGILGALAQSTRLRPVLYGTASERARLLDLAGSETGVEVETDLPLERLCGRLMASGIAVGNDSGGVHLAAALGVPTLALFGSTSPVWTAPRGSAVRILAGRAPCSPCFDRTCRKGTMSCFSDLTADLVLGEAGALLAGGGSAR